MKVQVKDKWDHVTLREFCDLLAVDRDQSLANRPQAKKFKYISILSGNSEKDCQQLSHDQFETLKKAVSFVETKPPTKELSEVEIEGRIYKACDHKALTAGEMISFEQYLIEGANTGRNTLPDQLGILLRPLGVNGKPLPFDTDTLAARTELFLDHLTVPFFFGLLMTSSHLEN